MELLDFRRELLEETKASAEARQTFIPESFVEAVGDRLMQAEEMDDFTLCRFEGLGQKGRKLRVDGFSFDETDGSATLLITLFEGEEIPSTIGQVDAKRQFTMLRAFVEEALSGRLTDGSIDESTPGYGLAADLEHRKGEISRFHFYLASDAQLSSRVKDWPEDSLSGVPTEFHIWDITRFHRAFESATGRDDLDIQLSDFGVSGLPALKAGAATGEYQAYLCMIPGAVLADLYDRYGSRLLEGNVRSFLSTKGKVNSQLQVTIRKEPEMFFAYNNGIAATAESIEFEEAGSLLNISRLRNLQIVNGGQTTASLAAAKRKDNADLGNVSVQMKLSVIRPERAATLIPSIAKYANSQNKVSDADFFSNHPYHVRVEEFSRRLWTSSSGGKQFGTHWFYERARGQYLNESAKLTKAQKAQFLLQNPRNQLLTKTDWAKLENTWRGLPHKVSLGAQKNFMLFADRIAKSWTENDVQFNEIHFRQVVAVAILFKHTERLVAGQPWYQNAYRANIVTYALAKLQDEIAKRPRVELNLVSVWEKQSVPPALERAILILLKPVFDVLTSPDAGIQNVTEWAKKEACWTRVRNILISLPPEVDTCLVSKEETKAIRRAGIDQQVMDTGIAAQVQVMKTPAESWRKLHAWGSARALISPKESQILSIASQIPTKIPSDKQCELLLALSARLVTEGYEDSAA